MPGDHVGREGAGHEEPLRAFELPNGADYVMATPHMQRYLGVSSQIHSFCLRYTSHEGIHVNSANERFTDATPYLNSYRSAPKELLGGAMVAPSSWKQARS